MFAWKVVHHVDVALSMVNATARCTHSKACGIQDRKTRSVRFPSLTNFIQDVVGVPGGLDSGNFV